MPKDNTGNKAEVKRPPRDFLPALLIVIAADLPVLYFAANSGNGLLSAAGLVVIGMAAVAALLLR